MEENELSFLYKTVVLFQCPARLIIVRDVDATDNLENFTVFKNSIYESAPDAMYRLLLNGSTNIQIIDYFKFHLTDYTDTDINMIFFDKIREITEQANELLKEIKKGKLTKESDILKAAKNIVGTYSYISKSYYKSLYERTRKMKEVMSPESLQLQIKNNVNTFTRQIQNLQSEESATFNNYSQILKDYNTWYFFPELEDENSAHMRECIQDEIFKDILKRIEVRERNDYISQIKKGDIDIYITETEIKSATFLYKPKNLDGQEVTEEDGYEIFDSSVVSEYVPPKATYNKNATLTEKYDKYFKPLLQSKMDQYDVRSYEKDGEVQSITICLRK